MTWGTIWEAFTAVGTVAMAVTTVLVIRQNKQQRQEIARQHQDTFKPVCVLVPDEGLAQMALANVVEKYEESGSSQKFYSVKCSVRNIGAGPAIRLRLYLHLPTDQGSGQRCEFPPLGKNQSIASPLKIAVFLNDQFNAGNFQLAPGTVWELWLEYEDIFGNVFHTRHTKNPQEPWAKFGKGRIRAS